MLQQASRSRPWRQPSPSDRHEPDYGLLAIVVALVVIGLIAVYSSSYALGALQFEDANYFIKRQAVWAAVGLLGLLVVMQIDYRRLLRPSPLPAPSSLVVKKGSKTRDCSSAGIPVPVSVTETIT